VKVTPPERALLRYMTRQFWATAAKLAEGIEREQSWVLTKLRRLEKLGLVEWRPDTQKVWRLTTKGDEWKREHLIDDQWKPATMLPANNVSGIPVRVGAKHGTVLYRDRVQKGDCVGVEFSDGSFDWVPVREAEVALP
jgi:hypothetical protein